MKKIILVLSLIIPVMSMASVNESTLDLNSYSAYGNFGFWEGGVAIGGDIEYGFDRTYGLGGSFRYYTKDSDKGARGGGSSFLILGGFVRPHFNRKAWDFYLSPGFNLMLLDTPSGNETIIGPSISTGLIFQFTRQFAFGIESSLYAGWLNSDYQGMLLLDMLLKGRFSF